MAEEHVDDIGIIRIKKTPEEVRMESLENRVGQLEDLLIHIYDHIGIKNPLHK